MISLKVEQRFHVPSAHLYVHITITLTDSSLTQWLPPMTASSACFSAAVPRGFLCYLWSLPRLTLAALRCWGFNDPTGYIPSFPHCLVENAKMLPTWYQQNQIPLAHSGKLLINPLLTGFLPFPNLFSPLSLLCFSGLLPRWTIWTRFCLMVPMQEPLQLCVLSETAVCRSQGRVLPSFFTAKFLQSLAMSCPFLSGSTYLSLPNTKSVSMCCRVYPDGQSIVLVSRTFHVRNGTCRRLRPQRSTTAAPRRGTTSNWLVFHHYSARVTL